MSERRATTATFLVTYIEGSTELVKAHRGEYASILADYHRSLRDAFSAYGGREVDNQGDSFFVAFARARNTVLAAASIQRSLAEHAWPGGAAVRVRRLPSYAPPPRDASTYRLRARLLRSFRADSRRFLTACASSDSPGGKDRTSRPVRTRSASTLGGPSRTLCVRMRGVGEEAKTKTSAWRGAFRDAALRREFLDEVGCRT